ncbi:hypothetical protein BH11BAC3_BH11BAC3_36120 [soil metagenome]
MRKEQTTDLVKFMEPFDNDTRGIVFWLRDFIWDLYPSANELIYDNYNAVAIGWSPTDRVGHIFCNLAIGRTSKNIHFGFYWGSQVNDTKKILIGKGNQYRYLLVKDTSSFPKTYIKKLMKEAYQISLQKVKDKSQFMEGETITKSISAKKRTLKKDTTNTKK